MLVFGFVPLAAIGTSQVLQIVVATSGTVGNLQYGSIDFMTAGLGFPVRAGGRPGRRANRARGERDHAAAHGGLALHRGGNIHAGALAVSSVEEHLATRRAAGLFDFSFMGLYEFYEKNAAPGACRRATSTPWSPARSPTPCC